MRKLDSWGSSSVRGIHSKVCSMTTIGYVFLDAARDLLIPLVQQQQVIEDYAKGLGLPCKELLVEQSYGVATMFQERKEGKRLLANVQRGDTVLVMRAAWLLGNAANALLLIDFLREKEVSVFCVDLDGDIVRETGRKLKITEGIAPLVRTLCEALTLAKVVEGAPQGAGNSAAIKARKARQKKEGKYLGGPVPFGFQVAGDGCLGEDSQQQKIIDEMVALKEDRWSYRDIAGKMRERHELKFSHEGVRKILSKRRQSQ